MREDARDPPARQPRLAEALGVAVREDGVPLSRLVASAVFPG
jgi:hypothetical protein